MTPQEYRNLYRIPVKIFGVLVVVSLLLHIALVGVTGWVFPWASPRPQVQHTRIEASLAQSPRVAETRQETAKEPPKKAQFESDRNLRADEDTSPDRAASNLPQKAGPKEIPKPTKSSPQKKEESSVLLKKKKILSFSQDDLLKEEKQKNQKQGDGSPQDSTGFIERLKRGQELKISALESDFGQYVTRMTRKISQQWNPKRTITPAMYSYDQVRVDIGVVLDRQGEVKELKKIGASSFSDFDDEAIRAVRDASPFPNPPKSLIQDDGYVYMPWSFLLMMRQGGFQYVE